MKGLKVGAKVKCFIARVKIEDGTIQEKDGMFYICQNKIDGERCKDILGYKYSWRIGSGSAKELSEESVTEFRIIISDIEDAQEGDIIVSPKYKRKVLGRIGKIIFASCLDKLEEYSFASSLIFFKRNGYKIEVPKEEEDDMVDIVVDGVTTKISRKSALALNLIK